MDLERLSNIVGLPMHPMRPQDIERRRHREILLVVFFRSLSRLFAKVKRENALLFIIVLSAPLMLEIGLHNGSRTF